MRCAEIYEWKPDEIDKMKRERVAFEQLYKKRVQANPELVFNELKGNASAKKADRNLIDFEKQLTEYKEHNEYRLPYTGTQVEDAMYINQKTVVTLEYHNFQNDSKYFELEEQHEFQDGTRQNVREDNLLKTYLFEGAAANSNSQFDNKKEDVSYYKLRRGKNNDGVYSNDILQMEKAKKEESRFSVVHAEAMVDGGSVVDMYDKTIGGIGKLARKAMKRAGKKEAEDANAH